MLQIFLGWGIESLSISDSNFANSLNRGSCWFVRSCLALLVLSPCLAICLNAFSQKQLLVLGLIFAAVLNVVQSGSLEVFIACFVIAACIRLHVAKETQNSRRILIVLIAAVACLMLWPLFCRAIGHPELWFAPAELQAFPTLLIAACLLLLFRNLNIGHIPFINTAAATTLGIYLIHDNFLVRHLLWRNLLQVSSLLESPFFPLFSVFIILSVFCACALIEYGRSLILTPVFELLLKPAAKLDPAVTAFFAFKPCLRSGSGA